MALPETMWGTWHVCVAAISSATVPCLVDPPFLDHKVSARPSEYTASRGEGWVCNLGWGLPWDICDYNGANQILLSQFTKGHWKENGLSHF